MFTLKITIIQITKNYFEVYFSNIFDYLEPYLLKNMV